MKTYRKFLAAVAMLAAVQTGQAEQWSLDSCVNYAVAHNINILQQQLKIKEGGAVGHGSERQVLAVARRFRFAVVQFRTCPAARQYVCRPQYVEFRMECRAQSSFVPGDERIPQFEGGEGQLAPVCA